ncbi:unnamed protein product, partial [Ectocarpus sp. 13 AM-2016]
MELLLEATDLGDVNVTRSDSDGRGGYSWSVTFHDYVGDVPALVADNDLTGYSASITVVEEVQGNELGGTFALELEGYVTDDMAHDVTAEVLQGALEDLGNIGTVDVTRTEIGSEGGAEYSITFEDVTNSGDVTLLVAHSDGLTGAGSTVVARE